MTPDERLEAAARAAAKANGYDFDRLPSNKQEWTAARGEFSGRYRDINEPMKLDYVVMAKAAFSAAYPELSAGTHWLAPMRMTAGMESAVIDAANADMEDTWRAARDAYLKEGGK